MKPTYIWGAGHYGVLTALDCEQRGIEVAEQPIGTNHIQPLMVLRKI